MEKLMSKIAVMADDFVKNEQVCSISVGIITNNKSYRYQSGYQQLLPEVIKLSEEPIFDLASLTKVTTTLLLVLKLIEEKRLSLDTKICSILSDYPHKETDVLELLTHTSGLPSDDKRYKSCKNKDEIYAFIKALPESYVAKQQVLYSCFNYLILGFVVEKLVGDMQAYAHKVIWEPLDMGDTDFNPAKSLKERCVATEISSERGLIKGEVHDGKAYICGGVAGNAGVFSSLKDLFNLATMFLNEGVFQGKIIFKPETMALLNKVYTPGLNQKRTLGWYLGDEISQFAQNDSDSALYHTGFTGTSMYIDQARKCAIIILTNRVHPSRSNDNISMIRNNVHKLIIDSLDGLDLV